MTTVRAPTAQATATRRRVYLDNLKVVAVAAVILTHVMAAWTGIGTWVLTEPQIREPLFSLVALLMLIGGLTGLAPFFLIAGMLTPRSLARKGPGRFLADRTVRLGVPMVFFVIVLSPFVEYFDTGNAGWSRGVWAFLPHIWWPPAPGPTWFLGVLLLFSAVYALVRTVVPARPRPAPVRGWYLLVAAAVLVAASYLVRIAVPFGEERGALPHGRFGLALGQAPAWVVAFGLGVLAGERGWFDPVPPGLARICRRVAIFAIGTAVVLVAGASLAGTDMEVFFGGGTWQSLVVAFLEAAMVIALPVWMLDFFRRRYDHAGRLGAELGRGAYAAYLIHQAVLVALVLAIRQVSWPPEIEFLTVAVLGVVASFALAALLVRIPGVSRVV